MQQNTNTNGANTNTNIAIISSLLVAVADEEEMGGSALGAANNLYKCKYKRNTNA